MASTRVLPSVDVLPEAFSSLASTSFTRTKPLTTVAPPIRNQEFRESPEKKEIGAQVVDLVVVGAGPHALSLMSKLVEPRVDPNEEIPQNTTLFKRNKHGVIKALHDTEPSAAAGSSLEKDLRRFQSLACSRKWCKRREKLLQRCMVLDANGEWMAQWHRQFETLSIPMLRSPISAHPDPIDREMLRLFAEKHKRRGIDTVDLDIDRSKAFHGPYEVPKTRMFEEFCQSVKSRYALDGVLRRAYVTRIIPVVDKETSETDTRSGSPLFELHTEGGEKTLAKNVVVAVGSLNNPSLPLWAKEARESCFDIPEAMASLLHSNDIITEDKDLTSTLYRKAKLLVVGGGLTAGHLALKALRWNENLQVAIISRRNLVKRQFDLELKWMGMKRTNNLAEFWSVGSMEERVRILRQSKNGGSMSPEVLNELLEFESLGRLELLENVEVIDAQWGQTKWITTLDNGEQRDFDTIWCATGTCTDFRNEPIFTDLCKYGDARNDPIEVVEGFPVLAEDLRVHKDLNVFVMGMYAGLRVGPGALNIMGGKAAASRIANALGIGLRGPCSHTTWQARSH